MKVSPTGPVARFVLGSHLVTRTETKEIALPTTSASSEIYEFPSAFYMASATLGTRRQYEKTLTSPRSPVRGCILIASGLRPTQSAVEDFLRWHLAASGS